MKYGLTELAYERGYESVDNLLEDSVVDSIVPGICVDCGATYDYEPDQDKGWCDRCEKNTVKSCLCLAGF